MQTLAFFRKLTLLIVLIMTIGFVYWMDGAPSPRLLAAESPLAQPWPTLVVTYPAQLPNEPPASVPAPQAARVSFLFHSPLPLPTPIPDAVPPTTAVQMSGEQGAEAWYRRPVSLTFALSDDFGAGYTEYKFDNAAAWLDREYYYPALVLAEEGVHTLEYRSLDTVRNTEAPQTTQIRIDRTPPQANEPVLDGNPLPNGWYNQPLTVNFSGADALSGVAGLERLGEDALWQATDSSTALATTGQHTLAWRVVDKAGNRSSEQQLVVMVDLTPPTTTHTLPAPRANGWYSQPITLALDAVDDGAGVFQTQYRLNAESSWRLYAAPIVLSGEGVQTVEYYSTDRALNTETPHTLTLPIDLTAPTIDVTVNNGVPTNGWQSALLTVTAQASDAHSGLAMLQSDLDNAGWQPATIPVVLAAGQLHTIRFRALDAVGHEATTALFTLGGDTQPPTTTLHVSPQPGAEGWFSTPISVTLVTTDTGAGVFQTYYRQPPENGWHLYHGPFSVVGEGAQTIAWYTTDQALNLETVQTTTLPIDQTAPQIETSISSSETTNGWYRAMVTVTTQANDADSGVERVQYELDNTVWQPYTTPLVIQPGVMHTLRFQAIDRAGHTATTNPLALGVDAQPPTTTLLLSQAPNAAGWFHQPLTLTLVATDTETGVFQTQYQWQDQASPAIYQRPLRLAQEGRTALTWFSLDRALNQELPQTRTLNLDLTAPVVTYTISGGSPLGAVAPGWYQTAATVHVTATDALAGVAQVEYALDSGGWQPYTAELSVTAGGHHTVQLRARDAADNVRVIETSDFGIDTIAPHSSVQLTGGRAPNGWYVTPVTVTLTTTDTGAGVAAVQWRLNGGLWQSYTAPLVITTERVNLLEYYAVDKAGNQEAPQFSVFSLDLADPASRVAIVQGISGDNGWYVSPVALTLNGQDEESGLTTLEYALDAQPWQPYTTPLTVQHEGIYRVQYRAVDASGRAEATRTLTVALDFTPPVIQTTLPTTVTYGNLVLTEMYTVTDAVSGVLTTTLWLNDQPYPSPQSLHMGANTVAIHAVNGAGLEARHVQTIIVQGGRFYLPVIRH